MGYRAIVNSNVTTAFNMLRDLAEDVTLNESSGETFDFGTGETVAGDNKSVTVKAVVIQDDKQSTEHNTIKRQILFKTRGLGDINVYDSVVISGDTWRFGSTLNDDGYTVLAEVYKEA